MYKDKYDVNLQNSWGNTILHLLIENKKYDLFKKMFKMFKNKMDNKLYSYCIKKIEWLEMLYYEKVSNKLK